MIKLFEIFEIKTMSNGRKIPWEIFLQRMVDEVNISYGSHPDNQDWKNNLMKSIKKSRNIYDILDAFSASGIHQLNAIEIVIGSLVQINKND